MEPQQVMRQPEVAGAYPGFDPRFDKQLVDYHGSEKPGTIIIDTPNKFLFLVQGNGTAVRYGVGVRLPGFTWSAVKHISAENKWPAVTPPTDMPAALPH